jgi:hypothetical protein
LIQAAKFGKRRCKGLMECDMLRSMIESALADLPQNCRPAVAPTEWRAISSPPEHYKDGRFLLFWEKSGPVVGRWLELHSAGINRSFWSTGFATLPDGEFAPVIDPLYWAEIGDPRLWPSQAPGPPA